MQAQLARTVKTLESKKLIKSVKSVQAAKRRLYMLYDLTPDESITGGAWYSDQDFESEFVEILNRHCLKFLQQKVSFMLNITIYVHVPTHVYALFLDTNNNDVCLLSCDQLKFVVTPFLVACALHRMFRVAMYIATM